MNKTHLKELNRTIRGSLVTFISISLFAAMSFALFFGFGWVGQTVVDSVNDYYVRNAMHDVEIQTVFGCDDDMFSELKTIEGVDEIEGRYETYAFWDLNGDKFETRISSITSQIDFPTLIDGELPDEEGEIAFANVFKEEHDIEIGDEITFDSVSANLSAPGTTPLKTDTYVVTCFFDTAPYLSKSNNTYGVSIPDSVVVNCLAFVDTSSFNEEAFAGYSSVLVRSDSLREFHCYSDEYKEKVLQLKDRIEKHLDDDAVNVTASTSNYSYIILEMTKDVSATLRYTLAGTFVILGVLIALFAIYRLIYDASSKIGAKLAMGFEKRQIQLFYMFYMLRAVIIGAAFGIVMARFAIEPAVVGVINRHYSIDNVLHAFSAREVLLFFVINVALYLLMVLLSCHAIVKRNLVAMINGEASEAGKIRFREKSGVRKTHTVFVKCMRNNFFNEKRRVIATFVGVISSATLIICALSLRNNVDGSLIRQYRDIYHYDTFCYFEKGKDTTEIRKTLDERGIKFAEAYMSEVSLERPGGESIGSIIMVAGDDDFDEMVSLRDSRGTLMDLGDGVYSSISYKEYFGTDEQAEITFVDSAKESHTLTTKRFFEFYLMYNLLVMNKETYEEEFDKEYSTNVLLIDRGGYSVQELTSILEDTEGFVYLTDDYEHNKLNFYSFASVFSVILVVYLILAVGIAFMVVLNLLYMHINEKKRELITLMINGYPKKAAKRYIYADTVILSIFAIFTGIFFGTLMSDLSIGAIKNETLHFQTGFDAFAIIIGSIIVAALVLVILLFAMRKVAKLEISDINEH